MKKRLKGLLALTLALCLVLGMTTGIASAEAKMYYFNEYGQLYSSYIEGEGYGDQVNIPDIVNTGDIFNSTYSGTEFVEIDDNGNVITTTSSTGCSKQLVDEKGNVITKTGDGGTRVTFATYGTFEVPENTSAAFGYEKDSWVFETGILEGCCAENVNVESIITIRLTSNPINCNVSYDLNGGEGSAYTNTFNILNVDRADKKIHDGKGLTKNGGTIVKWNTKADGTGTDYSLGSTMDMDFLKYVLDNDESITLYAVWTEDTGSDGGKGSSEGPQGDGENDENKGNKGKGDDGTPDSGDDSNMLPWATLATAALLASLGLVLTSRRRKA